VLELIAPYAEVLFGLICVVSAIFLFKPLKAFATAHGERDTGKVFCRDDMLILGWFLLLSFGVGIALFGVAG
jgi:hypothetical protein